MSVFSGYSRSKANLLIQDCRVEMGDWLLRVGSPESVRAAQGENLGSNSCEK